MKQAKDMNRDDDIHSGGRRGGDRHSSLDSNTLPFEFVLFSFFYITVSQLAHAVQGNAISWLTTVR